MGVTARRDPALHSLRGRYRSPRVVQQVGQVQAHGCTRYVGIFAGNRSVRNSLSTARAGPFD